jgi:coniferyl-aldehyde dehydrogenase
MVPPIVKAAESAVQETMPDDALRTLFERQRSAFARECMPTLAARRDRLERLLRMTRGHAGEIESAISADFSGRSLHETRFAELLLIETGIRHMLRHLRRWCAPRRIPTALHFLPARNRIVRQPLGVVGVISPWNYPWQLAIVPAAAALAAGNRVLIKPSEITPRSSALMRQLIERNFDPAELTVVTGDAAMGQAFAALPFDHLFFTGSTAVGRKVAEAAARNLTPVTLELGGKSPAILDTSVERGDVESTIARSIAFGKLVNAGQTCIAPDYVLAPREKIDHFTGAVLAAARELYPSLRANSDYTAIVTERHRTRLGEMLAEARAGGARIVEVPNDIDASAGRKFPLTLVIGATESMRVLREEIFGPILPIVAYGELGEAIDYVNRRERPLALYWYGRDTAHRDRVLHETVAGGVAVNDCVWHFAQEDAPFGGVGASGMGAYHGERGFLTFTKEKPVFYQSRWNALRLIHPPYGRVFEILVALLKRIA